MIDAAAEQVLVRKFALFDYAINQCLAL